MEVIRRKVDLYFDAQRQGYDSAFWATVTGTPSLNGSNNIQFTTATAVGTSDISSGEVTFFLKVPTAPTAGQSREWGVVQLNSNAKATFKINGTAFTTEVSNLDGDAQSSVITWDSSYTSTLTKFQILFSAGNVTFYINGIKQDYEYSTPAPNAPMSVYVKNAQGDAVELSHIQIRNADLYAGKNLMSGSGGGGGPAPAPGPSVEQAPYTPYQNDSFTTANVKASSGHVYSFIVRNTTSAPRYFQLHDTATTPASGETPEFKVFVPAGAEVAIGTEIFGEVGKYMPTGIAVANSTTSGTYTAGSAADLLLDLFYDGALTTTYMLLESGDELLLETSDIMLQE